MFIKTTRENGNVGVAYVFIMNPDSYEVNFMRKRDDGLYELTISNGETVMKTDVIQEWDTYNPVDTGLFEAVEGQTKAWKLVGEIEI